MKILKCILTIIFITVSFYSFSQSDNKAIGNWSGELDLPTGKLELIFKISIDEFGILLTKMDVPAQGARGLAVEESHVSDDSLFLNVAVILGKFEGKFITDSTIDGNWKQSGMTFPLSLKKTNEIAELKRPQTPVGPFPYEIREVEYLNPVSGFKISGTLTLPLNAKNCPAVVLISGSGAQDRNETIFEHKPFLVIADYLTRKGVAVLRLDDRGVGGTGGNISEATSEDFASDVESGVDFLKSVNEINSKQIGFIGHSEGGLIAPIVATKLSDAAFVILLAGPGIIGERILYAQAKLLNQAAGATDEQTAQNRKLQENIFSVLKSGKDSDKLVELLQNAMTNGAYQTLNDEHKKSIDAQIAAVNNNWFKFFLTYDPYPTLTKVKCPVLALNGSKDLQVPADENLAAVEKALQDGGNKNFKTLKTNALNHLFQHCETGAATEYANIEETFSPEVLDIMNNWIWNSALKN